MILQIVFVAMYKDLHFTLSVNRDKYIKEGKRRAAHEIPITEQKENYRHQQ